jgi:hypothetical protein
MNKSTELKQQAIMLKAAYEEGWKECKGWRTELRPDAGDMAIDWCNSTAKQMHDQLLMEAQGGTNVTS